MPKFNSGAEMGQKQLRLLDLPFQGPHLMGLCDRGPQACLQVVRWHPTMLIYYSIKTELNFRVTLINIYYAFTVRPTQRCVLVVGKAMSDKLRFRD